MGLPIYAIPALVALIAKGILFAYARFSQVRNFETRLYLFFLFALSIQNLAEILTFRTIAQDGLFPKIYSLTYYGASIAAIALLLHITVVLAVGTIRSTTKVTAAIALYAPAVILGVLLFFTPWLVVGFEPLSYTVAKIPGNLYFLFEIYALSYLSTGVALLIYGSLKQNSPSKRLKNKFMLLGMSPVFFVAIGVISLSHFGVRYLNPNGTSAIAVNTTMVLPIALTFFLAVTAYAIHQHRIFDIQFYIPWSKVRKRKTAFYPLTKGYRTEYHLCNDSLHPAYGAPAGTRATR